MDGQSAPEVLTKVQWMQRFSRRLVDLRPTLSSIAAATHSVDCYRTIGGEEPEKAAEELAEEVYPVDRPHSK